jgi:hypothetical protein
MWTAEPLPGAVFDFQYEDHFEISQWHFQWTEYPENPPELTIPDMIDAIADYLIRRYENGPER